MDRQVRATSDETGTVSASPGHTSVGTGSHNWSVNLRITDLMYEITTVQARLQPDNINLCDTKSAFVHKRLMLFCQWSQQQPGLQVGKFPAPLEILLIFLKIYF